MSPQESNADLGFQNIDDDWPIPSGVVYLNHGSFGPTPHVVQREFQRWSTQLAAQPMEFFVRRMEQHLEDACQTLGKFVGADGDDLILVDNATAGMNIVAANVQLQPGDQVLVTDQEYGAVMRIWRKICAQSGAELVVKTLPAPLLEAAAVAAELMGAATEKTRLIIVSHITSPTAVILPVAEICRQARERGIAVCIDGPHAVAMLPIDIKKLGCDYYTASCHKWLSAPFGSGFLYVRRRHQQGMAPADLSWGRSLSGRPVSWKDEFNWKGTRNPAALLSIPRAIEFLEGCGIDRFRSQSHELAAYARAQLLELTGVPALTPDSPEWYGTMISLPLPDHNSAPSKKPWLTDVLQQRLCSEFQIEIPVMQWQGRRLLRVSCHLYNTRGDIDYLMKALRQLLA